MSASVESITGTKIAEGAAMGFQPVPKSFPAFSKPETDTNKDEPKILDAHGKAATSTMTVKNQNVVQIPTWVLTTFGIPAVLFLVYCATFWTETRSEIKSLNEQVQKLNADKEKEQDAKMQKMMEDIYRKGQLDGVKIKELTK